MVGQVRAKTGKRSQDKDKGKGLVSPSGHKIIKAALSDDVSVAELGDLASRDPAFSVRILSVANSALYSRGRNIQTVAHASSLLGVRGLRNVALAMLVTDFVPAAEGASVLLGNCLRRAICARELASRTNVALPEDAFFSGLLLEVGLLQQACDEFDDCVIAARTPGRHRVIQERAMGLTPHPVKGAELAQELGLPENMILAIQNHHQPQAPEEGVGKICWVAELVASTLEEGLSTHAQLAAEAALRQLGLGPAALTEILHAVGPEVAGLAAALNSPAGPLSHPPGPRGTEEELEELFMRYDELMRVVEKLMNERDILERENEQLRLSLAQTVSGAPSVVTARK